MSEEENKPKRTVRITLDRKFGVSEAPERRPRRNDDERGSFGDKPSFRGDRGDRRFEMKTAKAVRSTVKNAVVVAALTVTAVRAALVTSRLTVARAAMVP